jgi:2-dehydro-3-deoxyphosphogluconate aldolase / (4S)-4-hydroxy-2-oxoglutarate aldolase
MPDITTQLGTHKLVPVLVLDSADSARPLAEALSAGGLPVAEVTFRTAAAEASIREMAWLPGMLVGAGTVLSVANAQRALDAGAKFIVSPGLAESVVTFCLARGVPVFPGAVTPTEIQAALELGLDTVKFFPADIYGGAKAIKALAAPFPKLKFIPTGGISAANLADYLALPCVHAVGGSWMAGKDLISAGKWREITQLTADAVALVSKSTK